MVEQGDAEVKGILGAGRAVRAGKADGIESIATNIQHVGLNTTTMGPVAHTTWFSLCGDFELPRFLSRSDLPFETGDGRNLSRIHSGGAVECARISEAVSRGRSLKLNDGYPGRVASDRRV